MTEPARARVAMALLAAMIGCTERTERELAAPSGDPDRGEALYLRGVGANGAVQARVGPGVPFGGPAAACANCHGRTGRGTTEGGISAPPLVGWRLFRPVRDEGDGGRPGYTAETLGRALRDGVGAGGARLSEVMPRYDLGQQELADLLAYLRVLEARPVPGVSGDAVRVRLRVGESSQLADDVVEVVRATFEEVNAQGGIYGRKLVLLVVPAAAPPPDVLADLASVPGEADPGAVDGVPEIGPWGAVGSRERRFEIAPGPAMLARLAIEHFALTHPKADHPRIELLRTEDEGGRAWAEAARDEAARRGWPEPRDRLVGQARARGGSPDLVLAWTVASELPDGRAVVYAPASLIASGALQRVDARFLSPWPVSSQLVSGFERFESFLRRNQIARRNLVARMHAWAATVAFLEALLRAGAAPDREGLVGALQSLRGISTGVTAPLSFGPSRRVGVTGAWLVKRGPQPGRLDVESWVELRE